MQRIRAAGADSTRPPVGTASRSGPSVTKATPTYRKLTGPRLILLATLLAAGCFGKAGHTYKLYPGPERPPEELATLKFGKRVTSLRVDGMRVEKKDYDRIDLLPGTHSIDWRTSFTVSPMVNPKGRDEIAAMATVELEAGHEYSVNSDRTTGPGYTMRWWLTDTTTGIELARNKGR